MFLCFCRFFILLIFFAPVGFNGTLESLHLFKVSMDFQKSNMDIVIVRIYELDTFYVQIGQRKEGLVIKHRLEHIVRQVLGICITADKKCFIYYEI